MSEEPTPKPTPTPTPEPTPPDKVPGNEQLLSRVSSNINVMAVIIGTFVTIGTSLSSCSVDNIERYKVFRESVQNEENYWKNLYDRYLEVVKTGDIQDANTKRQLAAINALTNHAVPTFEEHQLGLTYYLEKAPQKQAEKSISAMKQSLVDALKNPDVVGKEQAAAAQLVGFESEQVNAIRDRENSEKTSEQVARSANQHAAQSSISYNALTLAAGVHNGTDIDVFWCTGPNAQSRYRSGKAVASALAVAAESDAANVMSNGGKLGRIRLRALPKPIQETAGYPDSGNEVRGDATEFPQIQELATWLNRKAKTESIGLSENFVFRRINMRTPEYISVFVCSVAQHDSSANQEKAVG